jgi:uncharacterized protein YecT (DUF1311 family)
MIHRQLKLAVLACVIALPVAAQDTRDAELAAADAKLNETYKSIISQLRDEDREKLRTAQRAWIQMRDADCQWAFSDKRDCFIDRTDVRVEELQNTYSHTTDGQYKSLGPSQ